MNENSARFGSEERATEPKIVIFIHAALLPRCKNRLIQFFHLFIESKLIHNVFKIFINFVGRDDFPISDLDLLPYSDIFVLNRISDNILDFELPSLSNLYSFSILNQDCKILYIHTKSIGNDINLCIEDQINYMIYFIISKWEYCIQHLNSFSTVGVDLRNEPVLHYSGNFWWANASHIASLPDPFLFKNIDLYPNPLHSERHNQEFWICYNSKQTIHKSLWDCGISCYGRHLQLYPPNFYVNKPFVLNNYLHLSKYNSCNNSFPYLLNNETAYHPIGKYDNIVSYKYGFNVPELFLEQQIIEPFDYNLGKPSIYFVFDNQGLDALAHWIYESFIFYPLLLEVLRIHPDVKILTSNKKKYVKNMFKLFGINSEIVYEITDTNNICFFHPTIGINEDFNLDVPLIKTYLFNYIDYIQTLMVDFGTKYNLVYFPRNTKDNFAYNIIDIQGQENFENAVIEYGGTVVNTFQINNIHLQFISLYNSDFIIVDFGSSSLFNLIFLSGKTIFILNNRGWFDYHYNRFEFNRIHHDIICSKNTVHVINNNESGVISFDDILKFF